VKDIRAMGKLMEKCGRYMGEEIVIPRLKIAA
jgi:hypothetical protein